MRNLLFILMILPTLVSAADYTALPGKPEILVLKRHRLLSGRMEVRFIKTMPNGERVNILVKPGNEHVDKFLENFNKSDIDESIYCDGDFFAGVTNLNNQALIVNSIKSCVDEDGDIGAHSIGMKALSDKELKASAAHIATIRSQEKPNKDVDDSSKKAKEKKADDQSGSFTFKKAKSE